MGIKDTAWILNKDLTKEEYELYSLIQSKDKGKVDNFFEEKRKKKGILVEDRAVLNAPIKMSEWFLNNYPEIIKEISLEMIIQHRNPIYLKNYLKENKIEHEIKIQLFKKFFMDVNSLRRLYYEDHKKILMLIKIIFDNENSLVEDQQVVDILFNFELIDNYNLRLADSLSACKFFDIKIYNENTKVKEIDCTKSLKECKAENYYELKVILNVLDECIKEGILLKCDYHECTLVAKEIKKSNLKINVYNIKLNVAELKDLSL